MSLAILNAIAQVYGVHEGWLLRGEGEMWSGQRMHISPRQRFAAGASGRALALAWRYEYSDAEERRLLDELAAKVLEIDSPPIGFFSEPAPIPVELSELNVVHVRGTVAAGKALVFSKPETGPALVVPSDLLGEGTFALRAGDDSMSSDGVHRDDLIIAMHGEQKRGCWVLACLPGQTYCVRRWFPTKNRSVLLRGASEEVEVVRSLRTDVQVVCVVTGLIRHYP